MKKILLVATYIAVFLEHSEARLPKSQGELAAAFLMKKAGLLTKIQGHSKEIENLKANNEIYKFLISTIYTTDGRNAFSKWMKETFKNIYTTPLSAFCQKFAPLFTFLNAPLKHIIETEYNKLNNLPNCPKCINDITTPHEKFTATILANAFFPCRTGKFTAFAFGKDCTDFWGKNQHLGEIPAAKRVIQVPGVPSFYILSAKDKTSVARRYNEILKNCDNVVKKILWAMYVLETVDDTDVIEHLISIDIKLELNDFISKNELIKKYTNSKDFISISDKLINIKWPKASLDYDTVVPLPNTFILGDEKPKGTCMINTILNLLNIAGIDITNSPGREKIPGLTSTKDMQMLIDSNKFLKLEKLNFSNFINSLRYFSDKEVTDNERKIIANALNMQEKNVIISKNPYDAVWPNGEMFLKDLNGKDVTVKFGYGHDRTGYHMEITDIKPH